MRTQKQCGILELGNIEQEDGREEPGVKVRTKEGDEIFLPLAKEEVQALGKEGLLFRNVIMTITIEAEQEIK